MAEADIYTIAMDAPGARAGEKLRRARERAGIDLGALAAWTRINERHLVAIEEGDFAALPAGMYAVAFSRTYAQAVGLDGDAIAREMRQELDRRANAAPPRPAHHQEIEDPAKIPSARLAWAAGLAALALLVGLGLYWSSYFAPAAELPPVVAAAESEVPLAAPELSASAQISPTAESAVTVATNTSSDGGATAAAAGPPSGSSAMPMSVPPAPAQELSPVRR